MYLPSFYKLQFEKYIFNCKRAGIFMVPVVLWGNFFINKFSRLGILSSILQHSLHRFLPTSQRSRKKSYIIIMILMIVNTTTYFYTHLVSFVYYNITSKILIFLLSSIIKLYKFIKLKIP
jgi:hypothetical protein